MKYKMCLTGSTHGEIKHAYKILAGKTSKIPDGRLEYRAK